MVVRTRADMASQIATLLADNSTGDISEADVRSISTDIVDSAPNVSSGAGAPATAPAAVGDVYVDTTNFAFYVATQTTGVASTDWEEVALIDGGTDLSSYTGLLGLNSGEAIDVDDTTKLAARLTEGKTGTGALVCASSPSLTTPALDTPSAITLTNATGLPEAQVTQHQAALSITESQISDFSSSNYAALAGATFTGAIQFSGTTHEGVRLNSLTTTQRDALTPAAGMVIYNSTTTDIEAYDGTAWVDLTQGGGTGTVDTSGTPVLNDFARFTDADTIEGRSYAEVRADLDLVVGTNVQAHSADLDTYASNPLTAGELGQLQNIGATTISAAQWGYLGVADAYASTILNTADEAAFKAAVNLEAGVDFEAVDPDILRADTADQLTAGFTAATEAAGNSATITPYTPDPDLGNFKQITNNGAFTLNPPTLASGESTQLTIVVTNTTGAGALTWGGTVPAKGDSFPTGTTDESILYITAFNVGGTTYAELTVVALQ